MIKPQVIVIQETKIKRKSQIDLTGYKCFPTVRGDNGGGVLIACIRSLDPVLIHEGDAECEVMVVQIKVNNDQNIRIIGGWSSKVCSLNCSRII